MALLAAIGILAGASIAYEILLTRLFSILLWHHFAYMIISVALLGIGASGTVLAFARGALAPRFTAAFAGCAMLFAILSVGGFALAQRVAVQPARGHLGRRPAGPSGADLSAAGPPLLRRGDRHRTGLHRFHGEIASIYRADLIGAGLGALLIVGLLSVLAPQDCLRVLGGLGFLAAALAAWAGDAHRPSAMLALLAVIVPRLAGLLAGAAAIALQGPEGCVDGARRPRPGGAVEPAGTAHGRREPARSVSPRAGPQPRRHDRAAAAARRLHGCGCPQRHHPLHRRQGALGYLDQQTMALPYHVLDRPRTLILGAGGGADVLRALYHRAPHIDAVELNPDLIALVRGEFARFAGGIYDRTDVTVHSAEARSFVQASERSWDLIQVALLDSFTAAAAGVQALGESPLYTVEALRSYYAHLGPGGILAITRWLRSPPSDPIKLFATAIVALEQAGVSSPGDRLAMIHDWNTATLLVKEAPFDPAEIARMRAFAEARSFDVAWFSGIREAEANRFNRQEEPSLYRAATELLGPERERFLRIYKFHVEPATDDRPYFFRFFKFELLPELFALRAQGGLAQADTGYLVVLAALVQAGFASLVLILLPLAALRTRAPRAEPAQARPAVAARWRVAVYFLALGFGFMFIEISFIHRFTTFLGHPLAAIAVVLAAFLIFAGLGSGIAAEIEERRRAAVAIAVGGIILFAGTYLVVLPVWLPELIAWPFPAKAAVALLLIAPLGVAMGMPFPLGLARVAARTPGLVPWAWAINGCASVVGAVLASLLAMHVGFTVVVCLALALYAMAVLAFEAGSPRPAAIESGPETRAGVEAPAHRVGEARPPALDQSPEATARPAAVSGIPASGAPMA